MCYVLENEFCRLEFTEENRPDYVIEDFREILNILP